MNEEELSIQLFKQASSEQGTEVLSWQGVDGKNYFARDIKFRLTSGERIEPDLIIRTSDQIWIIELKGSHAEALSDEVKLCHLKTHLGMDGIADQLKRHTSQPVNLSSIYLAVAYDANDPISAACESSVVHISWEALQDKIRKDGLAKTLIGLT